MKKIIVIGSSNVDTTLHVEDFPKPGETINAKEATFAGGGKGANQAIASAQSGAATYFISRIGLDSFGDFIKKQLKQYGVMLDYVQTVPAQTGHAYITLNAAGQNNIIIDHGANYSLRAADAALAKADLTKADCVIAQFETPVAATIAAFKLAKKAGAVTILNPAPALPAISPELLQLTDIITPNETESAAITGIKITDQASLHENAQKLHDLGISNVIITYGKNGSYLKTAAVEKLVSAFKVKAVDTTGAGDTFIGYLAGKLKKDLSNLEEAAVFASCASSIAVQHLGAQPSIPTLKQVVQQMERYHG